MVVGFGYKLIVITSLFLNVYLMKCKQIIAK